MKMQLVVPLAAILYILIFHTVVVAPEGGVTPGRLERLVRSGLQSLQGNQLDRCRHLFSRYEVECRQHAHLPLSSVAVYVSEPHITAGKVQQCCLILS